MSTPRKANDNPRRLRARVLALALCVLAGVWSETASAGEVIRDEELEGVIRDTAMPLFAAAGYDAKDVRVIILKDDAINAYVSGGKNIFLNTGLLMFSQDVSVTAGVLAHELGHIRGGHLARRAAAADELTAASALGYVLGLATGVLAGPAAGTAVLSASQNMTERTYLADARRKEESADAAGLEFLTKAGYGTLGLEKLLTRLRGQEKASPDGIDPYARSHPLSGERLNYIRAHSIPSEAPPKLQARYRMAYAKLTGFLEDPDSVLKRYGTFSLEEDGKSRAARYAKAVAHYRLSELDRAFALADELMKEDPTDPYFVELKAQFLFETGKTLAASALYKRASQMLPDSLLMKVQYAAALLAGVKRPDDPALAEALHLTEEAMLRGEKSGFVLRQLGVGYGKAGNVALSNLYLAEWSVNMKDATGARKFLSLAKPVVAAGSPSERKWQDLNDAADALEKEKKE